MIFKALQETEENADFSHVSRRNAIYMENVTDSF